MSCPYENDADDCGHDDRPAAPGAPWSIRPEHAEHLLDFRCQLCRVAETARAVARRAQAIAQPLHVIRHRAVDACRAERRRQSIAIRSEEHTSELQSQSNLVCRLLLEKKKQFNARSWSSTPS